MLIDISKQKKILQEIRLQAMKSFWYWAVAFEGSLIALSIALGWGLGIPVWQDFNWDRSVIVGSIAITAPLLGMFFLSYHSRIKPLTRIKSILEEQFKPYFRECNLAQLLIMCLLAGFGEEMLFRGVLQPFFGMFMPIWLAILLASICFGLAHALTLTYFFLACGAGIYFGVFFEYFGNLTEISLAHGLYDFLVILFLTKSESA